MSLRIAINGFGRIGRNVLRALYERGEQNDIQVVAINDLGAPSINAHLLEFDSVHGRFTQPISFTQRQLRVAGDEIAMLSEREPSQLPWGELQVDVVLECTGRFTQRSLAAAHLGAGADRVLVSAPCKAADATLVYGVNEQQLKAEHQVISNASCTTNALAPVAQVLQQHLGIESGLMTTIHAYTNDQSLSDVTHSDPYRARAAGLSMIPTKTGAAAAIGLVLPALKGKLDGLAVRVPTANVSMVDLSVVVSRQSDVEEVNALMRSAAERSPILAYNQRPLVSIDFNHSPYSSVFDATQTRVNGRLVKVMAWYDNEWGFAHRMIDNLHVIAKVRRHARINPLAATA